MDAKSDVGRRIDGLKKAIREIPDFPKPGISFKDITPLLKDGQLFREAIDLLADMVKGYGVTSLVCTEARGFLIGGALALRLGCGIVPVRKRGKLPWKTESVTYDLEYGTDTLEVHLDGVTPGEKVLLVDDVLATGGTARAVADLVQKTGGSSVASCFLIELTALDGRKRLGGLPVHSLITY